MSRVSGVTASVPLRSATTPNDAVLAPWRHVGDELAIALLEDVQRQRHAGQQHMAEREERNHLARTRPPPQPGCQAGSGRRRSARKLGRMLRRLDLTGTASADLRSVLPRARVDVHTAEAAVNPVVEDIAARGYPAVRDATLRFDGVDVPQPRVPADGARRRAR